MDASRARYRKVPAGLTVGLLLTGLFTTSCSGREPPDRTPTASPRSPASSPSADPAAQPATDALVAYLAAANTAQRHPLAMDASYPADADFTRYSFDPLRTQFRAYLAQLNGSGIAFHGTSPTPNINVRSLDLDARPYPTVLLTDCPVEPPDWEGFFVKSGHKTVRPSTAVPPPYLITVKMIYYKSHWGAQSVTADTSKTCVP